MTTNDIELPQGYRDRPFDYSGDLYTEGQVRAIIEADRKRRGEPVAWIRKNGFRFAAEIEPQDDSEIPLYAAPQPAEPVKRKRPYAQGTALGEFGIVPMCDQVDDEPDRQHPDDVAVDAFAAAMKAKLKRAREEKGRGVSHKLGHTRQQRAAPRKNPAKGLKIGHNVP